MKRPLGAILAKSQLSMIIWGIKTYDSDVYESFENAYNSDLSLLITLKLIPISS